MRREFVHRAGWSTLLPLGLLFTVVMATIIVEGFFSGFTGGLSRAGLESALESLPWPFLVLIVATSAGAGTLAEDIGNRSITLYLSRPIHLGDYLLAKAAACGAWLLLATAAPGLAGVLVVWLLGYVPLVTALQAAAGFLAVGIVAGVFLTGLALALSSITNRSLNAGVAIFGLVFSLYIGVSVVSATTGNHFVRYVSPLTDLHSVALGSFGVVGAPTDPLGSAIGLLGAGVLLAFLAEWRMSRIEVVGE
jgi:ABC-type transport system involved in multi-copper enzyme maturation permease subunit